MTRIVRTLIATTLICFSLNTMAITNTPPTYYSKYLSLILGTSAISRVAKRDNAGNYVYKHSENFPINGGLALGYYFNPNWRAEISALYIETDADRFSINGISPTGLGGGVAFFTTMITGLYELRQYFDTLVPYVGMGVGATQVEESVKTNSNYSLKGKQITPSAQGIIGIDYHADTQLTVSFSYHVLMTGNVNLDLKDANTVVHTLVNHYTVQMYHLTFAYHFD
ncbi:MAG: hypothetical protein A3C55_03800 [Gammaproteobacteria bacterium RIFCSPHIGHO2_02_FULL_42_13]|nr:MAG: hypothetical protein A3C55_03800 [Gammaproteobacteria bacterium RIFCSPHIGHO2_02_FULL_42_13]